MVHYWLTSVSQVGIVLYDVMTIIVVVKLGISGSSWLRQYVSKIYARINGSYSHP